MKFDMKHLRRIRKDEAHTTLLHPAGHEIKIAHQHLSPKMRGELEAVPMSEESHKAPVFLNKGGPPSITLSKEDIDPNSYTPDINLSEKDVTPDQPLYIPSNVKTPDPEIQKSIQEYDQEQDPMSQALHLMKLGGRSISPETLQGNSQTQGLAQQPQGPATNPSQPSQTPQSGLDTSAGLGTYVSGYQQQVGGLAGEAEEKAKLAEKQAPYYRDLGDALANLQDQQNNINQDYQKDSSAIISDIKNGHIDPNKLWEDKSVPSKISSIFGMILGGMGGGLTHQENPAVKMLQYQIDKNVDAQIANQKNNINLFNSMRDKYKDDVSAINATKLMLTDTVINGLNEQASKSQSPIERFRALQAIGALKQSVAPNLNNLIMRQSFLGSQAAGSNPEQYMNYLRMADPKTYEVMQKSYVPGVGFASIDIPDKAREELTIRNQLNNAVQDLRQFAQQNYGKFIGPTAVLGATKAKLVQDLYRRANGQGVFREAEAKFVNNIVNQNPTNFLNSWKVDPQYKALEQDNSSQLNNLYQAYGIKKTISPQTPGKGVSPVSYTPKTFKPVGK